MTYDSSSSVKPSQTAYIKSTNDLLGQFHLHEAYNQYVMPFYATTGEAGGTGMGEMGANGPASPTTPGPGAVDKGKGREIPVPGSTPAAHAQTPAADGQDGDDEEGGGKGEKKKKNSYKHLIKGVPGMFWHFCVSGRVLKSNVYLHREAFDEERRLLRFVTGNGAKAEE